MKRISSSLFRRITALVCASALTVPSVFAAGETKLHTEETVVPGLTYSNTVSDLGGSRLESYSLELAPNSSVSPMLLSADGTIYGGATVNSAVEHARSLGYHVLAAMNGDFFSTLSGVPMGIVIEDGIYKSSSENEAAILIGEAGDVSLCKTPDVSLTLTNSRSGEEVIPHHFNKLRAANGGVYLLNNDFSTVSSRTSGSGWFVLLRPTEETPSLTVRDTMELVVTERFSYDGAIAIRENEYILTADSSGDYASVFESFQVGDRIVLRTSPEDLALTNTKWAGGCGDLLVENGQVTDPADWSFNLTDRAPRSAFGVKSDGTLVFHAADGRRAGHSLGLTEMELARELQEKGCDWAVNLDGGGSTAISVWLPGAEGAAIQNIPSDGWPRRCANYLLLVADQPGTGTPHRLAMTQNGLAVLKGTDLPLPETLVLDDKLNLLDISAPVLGITPQKRLGRIQDGIYTAGRKSGTDTLLLSSDELMAQGSAQVHVVDHLTDLQLMNKETGEILPSLVLETNATLALDVKGTYWGRIALRDLKDVYVEVRGGAGVLDYTGVFTAASKNATGTLLLSAGGVTKEIPITVKAPRIPVAPDHWAHDAVNYCNLNGIVDDVPTDGFHWDERISRADFVLALYNLMKKPGYTAPCTFTDVSPDSHYYNALCWGQEIGIANGIGDDRFAPDEALTREQAFTLLHRAMPLLELECQQGHLGVLTQYADAASISDYAKEHIATLTIQKLVNGTGSNVDPQGNLTWAHTAALVWRLSQFTPVIPDPTTSEYAALCTAVGGLNIRSGPDTSYPAHALLDENGMVVVTALLDGWYQVLYTDADGLLVSGYASADYLALQ